MNMNSSSGIALSLLLLTTAIAFSARAAQPQTPLAPAASPPAAGSNSVELSASPSMRNSIQFAGSDSPVFREMRERLTDPQKRVVLRAEQRASIVDSHPDLGQALDIDAATEQKLIELLTDQQMEQLEEFHLRREANGELAKAPSWQVNHQERADQETRRVEAQRELLGQERLERYQVFKTTFSQRMKVAKFNARLEPAHKLSAAQKEQLIALHDEHLRAEMTQFRRGTGRNNPFGRLLQGGMPSREELQRQSQLQTIEGNEENWRRMPESDRLLRERAAEFLTPPQLATLAKMNAEQADELRQWIVKARTAMGLSPEIPDQPAASEPEPVRTRIAGNVKVSIKLTVNRNEPVYFVHTVGNGEPVTFSTADGLQVKATPIVYDDEMFDLQVAYYEEGSTGKRLIGQMGQMGALPKAPASIDHTGGGGTVITGSKGYAINLSALVEST